MYLGYVGRNSNKFKQMSIFIDEIQRSKGRWSKCVRQHFLSGGKISQGRNIEKSGYAFYSTWAIAAHFQIHFYSSKNSQLKQRIKIFHVWYFGAAFWGFTSGGPIALYATWIKSNIVDNVRMNFEIYFKSLLAR